jgi:exodeoxyribonuclease VII small subunit
VAKKKPAKDDEGALSFEEALAELETIVRELESGKLGLSDALARYEQGVKHLKSCHGLLERAERRIELLSGVDADGNPITEPCDDQEHESLEEKAAARGRRRTSDPGAARSNPPRGRDMDDPGRLF